MTFTVEAHVSRDDDVTCRSDKNCQIPSWQMKISYVFSFIRMAFTPFGRMRDEHRRYIIALGSMGMVVN